MLLGQLVMVGGMDGKVIKSLTKACGQGQLLAMFMCDVFV